MQLPDLSALRVAVLYGGISNERPVSLHSGEQVHEALDSLGCSNTLIDTQDAAAAFDQLAHGSYDVAFIALHGKGGEDGSIQGVCELLGIPHTGSGVLASALAMDKGRAKSLYADAGIPTASARRLVNGAPYEAAAIVDEIGIPCVVKPIGDGSSVGMSIVHAAGELAVAIEKAAATGQDVLVERYVAGTEVTCAVLGNDEPEALPVIEIVPHSEFYDYEQKYSANGAEHVCPARLDAGVYALVQEHAVRAHRALGCAGMSRSDFIVTAEGVPYILETNTIPGMTSTSLLPDAARHVGYDFPALCATMVGYALEAARR
jgi:D-alanine-D-alanine ligase